MAKLVYTLKTYLLAALLLLGTLKVIGANRYSVANGSWNAISTWSTTSGGAPGASVPVAADNVVIEGGFTVTVPAAVACTDLTINATGTLSNTTFTISISGNLIVNGSITAGSGVYTLSGTTKTISGTLAIPSLTITGTYTNNGNLTVNTALAGAGGLTNSASGTLNIGGTSAITTLTASAAGNLVNYTGTGQTLKVITYHHLTLSGGAETFGAITTINGNLTLSNTATATTAAALTIAGNLNVGNGTTFTAAAFALTVNGTTTVGGGTSGILAISSATGIKTFSGAVAINSGGAITESAAAQLAFGSDVTISGTLTENGAAIIGIAGSMTNNGTYTASTGAHTFSGTAKTISGTNAISIPTATFTGNYTNNGTFTVSTLLTITGAAIVLTNNGTITATAALSGTGGLAQTASGVLNLGGTSGITSLTASAAGNTVNYNGGAAQTVFLTNYSNLTLSNAAAKTFQAGTTTVGGSWSVTGASAALNTNNSSIIVSGNISGTGAVTSGSGTITISGNWTNSGAFTAGTGTVNYNGTNQQVAGVTYNNLTISGGGTKALQAAATVNGTLSFSSGVLQLGNYNLTIANTSGVTAIAGTFSATNMAETNGTGYLIVASNTNNISFNGTFPVGNGIYYDPVIISGLANIAAAVRSISIRSVSSNPGILSNGLNKYWDINATNITVGSATISMQYNAAEASGFTTAYLPYTNTSGSWLVATGPSVAGVNPVASTGSSGFSGQWTAGSPNIFYSYQTGSWNTATTWTSDPSGTTQVGSAIPGNSDVIEILTGRTVSLPGNITSTNLSITIDEGGFLDLSSFQFSSGINTLSGQGTLIISSSPAVFPTITTNSFINAGGGTTEYRTNSVLPAQAIYNNLAINANGSVITQTINLTLNGDLHLKAGTFQVNDATARRLQLTIKGNTTVDAGAFFTIGTGVTNATTNPIGITGGTPPFINYYDAQSHRIVVNGDFTNNGTVRFTNLTNPLFSAFPPTSGTTAGFATVYFQGASDNTLLCAGPTDFYNLVLDKGTDQTFKLILYTSGSYSNFRLFGANTAGVDVVNATATNPNLKKALWIRTGTLELQGTTVIPSLSEGANGDGSTLFTVPSNGALLLNGVDVAVFTTADDYREINSAYGTSAANNAALGVTQGLGNGFSLYGKLQLDNGYFSTKESEGVITTNVASGQFILNNGVVDTKQFVSLTGSASFKQTGGTIQLRGRFQRTPSSFTNVSNLINAPLNTARANDASLTAGSGTFSLNNNTNVFTMGGGTMQIYDVCGTSGTPYAFQVNSSTSNLSVTGGTVQFIPTTGTVTADAAIHYITSTGPFGNVIINRASSTSTIQLSTAMSVLGNFTLTSGVMNANNLNLTVGGDLFIAAGTTYTAGTNTTILNGSGAQTFTINLASALSMNNFTITKPSGIAVNMAGSQSSINVGGNFNLTLGTLNDNGDAIFVAQNVYNSGMHSGTGKISLKGTVAQTIDGNGVFQNIELNNTNGAAGSSPVSLIANTTINGTLTFSQDRLFNIGAYNLLLNASASIVNGSSTRYIQTAGNAGDGGVTKFYSSATSFLFPIGAPSTRHAGVPKWTPATIGFNSAPTTYGYITIIPVGYEHPATTVNGQSLTYFWRVESAGFTGIPANSVTHTFVYDQTDVVGTEANYIPSAYNRTAYTWNNGTNSNPPINTATNTITDWAAPTNSKSFLDADYTAGDAAFGVPKVYYSKASGLWSALATWTFNSSHSGAQAGSIPGLNDVVIIGGLDSVYLATNNTTINTDIRNCASLQIEAGSALDIGYNPGCNFGMVLSSSAGNGNFRLTTSWNTGSTFSFPAGDFSDFNVNLGTTELYSTNPGSGTTYWLPNGVLSYGNLILSPLGGSNIIFPNNNLLIYGNLVTRGQNADSWFCPTWNTVYPNAPTAIVAKTITINGNLNIQGGALIWIGNGANAQNFVVNGNVIIGTLSSLYVNSGTNQSMSIGGSLINNADGITHAGTSTNDKCDFTSIPVTFFGPNNASITNTANTPPTTFSTVTINKGSSQATTLTCDIGGTLTTPADNWLTLINGTFRYARTNPAAGANFTISTTTPFNIPATAGLYVNMPANVNNINILIANSASNTNDIYLGGKLTVVNGNVYVGPVAAPANNNDIEYASAGFPAVEVNGGQLVVNGQIRRNPTITSGALSFTQTGGIVTINGNGSNTTNAKLEILNTGSTFNMSGGTLNVIRGGGGASYGDLFLRPDNSTVTGGTIVLSNVIPNTAQNYLLDATVPLNNLTIIGAAGAGVNAKATLMVNPIVLKGDLILTNAQSIFDANSVNNIAVTLNGNFTNNGTYNQYNNLTTFKGGTQLLSGTSVTNFYDLTVNPVTSLTINNNSFTVNDNLTLSNGTLILGSYNINLKADLVNNANYTDNGSTYGIILNGTTQQQISGTGTFGQLNLNNSAGATINNDITLNENLILTSGILDINQYLLTLGVNSIITASGTGFGISKMVTSDGVWSNVGIKKIFSTSPPASFTYPLGIPGKYTPTVLTITANGSTGSIRVNNINHRHPAVVDPNNVLNYYFEVESLGITGFSGNFLFTYLAADVIGGPECGYGYYSAKLITPGTNWFKSNSGVDCVNHKLTFNYTSVNDASITGEYTAGLDAAIPNTVPQYTSIADGNWTDQSIWIPSGGSTYPCPVGGPNGFVVTINNVVIANSNYCTSYKTYINGTLQITTPYFGHNLGTVYGNGTLYLQSPLFPAGRFGAFLDCAGNGTIEYGGTGTYNITADLFSSVPNLTFSGTGIRQLPNKDLTICHQLLINGPTLDNTAYNRELFIEGTMLLTSGAFKSGTGNNATVSFSGNAAQSIKSFNNSNAFNNLEINNSSGLTLTGPIDVSNKLLLTNGLITTSSINILKITNFSTSCVFPNGGSSASYVDGPLSKNLNRGDPVFKFPVGKAANGLGNKLALRATESGTMYWTVEYFYPNTFTTIAAPLTAINTLEYWTVNCTTPGSQAFVNVGWDPLSDLTPLMTTNGVSDLRVAEHNGTDWIQIPSTPNAGSDNYNGSVETSALTTLATGARNYTLGAINAVKPKVRMSPSGSVCGIVGIPVTLTTTLPIVAPFIVNYTENGIAKSITPASFPATIPTLAGGATYILTSFTYNYPAGTLQNGVVDVTPIVTYAIPTSAIAGPDQSLCGATSATLAANAPVTGTGKWSIISGIGGTVVSPNSRTSVFNGTNGSTYILRWTITNGACSSFDDVTISFPLLAAKPSSFLVSSATVCQASSGVIYTVPNDPSVTYNWSYSGSGVTIHGTSNSVNLDFSTSATAGNLNVTASNSCNTSAAQSMAIGVNAVGIWAGGTVGALNDWNTPSNWSCSYIPDLTVSVHIPNVANKPILSSGANGKANNILIDNGSSLTVTGNTLQIAGAITNNGTFTATAGSIQMTGTSAQTIGAGIFAGNTIKDLTINNAAGVTLQGPLNVTEVVNAISGTLVSDGNLTLISTVAKTALVDGTGAGTINGIVSMQRYLPSGYGYKYLSSPFQAATVNELADDIDLAASFPTLYQYDEDNHRDSSGVSIYTSGWLKYITTTDPLTPMRGYAANMGNLVAPKTVVISGLVSNNILTTQTLYNHNRPYTKGFNLIGNPYPSPIDWYAATGWTKTNIDNALYFFDNGTTDQYTGTYSTYINGVSSNGVAGNIIPSMQGFFIHVSNGTFPVTGILGMDNRVRVNNLSPAFHKSVFAQYQPIIRLAANYEKEKTADPAVVYFDDLATTSFDQLYDALKLFNTDVTVPNLYAITPQTERLSISAVPFPIDSISKYPLGLKIQKSDWVLFTASTITDIPSGLRVYLSDEATGWIQDLQLNPEYRIFLNSGTTDNRFALLFSKKDLVNTLQDGETFYAYVENGQLYVFVKLDSGDEARLIISNMLGQAVFQENNINNGLNQIDQSFPSGIYIITLYSDHGISSKKIYIPK